MKLDLRLPAEFVKSIQEISLQLKTLRETAWTGVFLSGLVVGLIAALLFWLLFGQKSK